MAVEAQPDILDTKVTNPAGELQRPTCGAILAYVPGGTIMASPNDPRNDPPASWAEDFKQPPSLPGRQPHIARRVLLVLFVIVAAYVARFAYIMSTDGAWHEVKRLVRVGNVSYKILFESDSDVSPASLSILLQGWPWRKTKIMRKQIIVIDPSDRTRERFKALDREIFRDNAGIWSLSIAVYDNESAARASRNLNGRESLAYSQELHEHCAGEIEYVEGVDEVYTLENTGRALDNT
jgi:hypothetical protein